jgi:hypothetical protein
MTEPVRAFDFADPTPQPVIMRLGWGSPVQMLDPATAMRFIPADEVWVSPYMEYLHRHPYQYRQQLIHALWRVGCRKQAQKAYWQGKLKRKERE